MKRLILAASVVAIALSAMCSCKADKVTADEELRIEDRPKIMWLCLSANWPKFSNPDTARYYIKKAADGGFNHLIVDVKGIESIVAYDSKIAPRLKSLKGVDYPDNYDYLDTITAIGR